MKRSDLAWTSSPKKTMSVVNGTDVEDLSRYKNILSIIRSDLLEDHVEGANRENLEKRLFLL